MSFTDASSDPRARDVNVSDSELIVHLTDGRTLTAPLAWFPRLERASAHERGAWELLGDGIGIHWPAIDEDISVAGLVRGERATR